MARPFTPRVGRHVLYTKADGRYQSALIIATGSINGGLVLRIGHSANLGDGTTGILRGPVNPNIANTVNTYRVGA